MSVGLFKSVPFPLASDLSRLGQEMASDGKSPGASQSVFFTCEKNHRDQPLFVFELYCMRMRCLQLPEQLLDMKGEAEKITEKLTQGLISMRCKINQLWKDLFAMGGRRRP